MTKKSPRRVPTSLKIVSVTGIATEIAVIAAIATGKEIVTETEAAPGIVRGNASVIATAEETAVAVAARRAAVRPDAVAALTAVAAPALPAMTIAAASPIVVPKIAT